MDKEEDNQELNLIRYWLAVDDNLNSLIKDLESGCGAVNSLVSEDICKETER